MACTIVTFFFFSISDDCVAFLRRQAKSLDLPVKVYEHYKGKPIVILTWVGTEPAKPSVMLNSHMDVVPVFAVSIPSANKIVC